MSLGQAARGRRTKTAKVNVRKGVPNGFSSPISGCGSLWEACRRDLEVGMESRVIGLAHAETAEPGEQAETHVRFRDLFSPFPPLSPPSVLDAIVGLGVANEPAARTYWT